MFASSGLLLAAKKSVDVSAHATETNWALGVIVAAVLLFFAIRRDLFLRIMMERVDPRPLALTRIFFGSVVVWTFVDLAVLGKFLFTDEGLWLTKMARDRYGAGLKTHWDPIEGLEHWYDVFKIVWGHKFTVLHVRSDPPFVYGIFAAAFLSGTLMVLGKWTRWTTLATWVFIEQLYRYSPVFYTGGDTVVRCFMFLGLWADWGKAYSLDSLKRRRDAVLGGASRLPALSTVPVWPQRLMMLQLACIYCATGTLKSGGTWYTGTALYYAMNLDHFYRFPNTGVVAWAQFLGILPLMTWVVHWWEILFPLSLVGVALRGYEARRASGQWVVPKAWIRFLGWFCVFAALGGIAYLAGLAAHYYLPAKRVGIPKARLQPVFTAITAVAPVVLIGLYMFVRRFARAHRVLLNWVLGRRLWLLFGLSMHVGIEVSMNVGTFVQVMMAVYAAWLTGRDIDGFWAFWSTRAAQVGEAGRPRRGRLGRLLTPLDALRWRVPLAAVVVHHASDEAAVRRAALVRIWDLSKRVEFAEDATLAVGRLAVTVDGQRLAEAERGGVVGDAEAAVGQALVRTLPALAWLRVFGRSQFGGRLARRVIGLDRAPSAPATPVPQPQSTAG